MAEKDKETSLSIHLSIIFHSSTKGASCFEIWGHHRRSGVFANPNQNEIRKKSLYHNEIVSERNTNPDPKLTVRV